MNVFDLFARLSLDSSEYDEGLSNAEKSASGFGKKLGSALGTGAKVAGATVAAVGTAAIAASAALVNATGDVAEYGDNIDKMSQKMGISAEAYQEWDAIMQHSGTTIEGMQRGLQTLQLKAAAGAEAFEQLGISQEELASMSTEDLFSSVITGLQNMEEGAERTALANDLLGGAAKELGALLNTSAEDTEAMRQRVHELGGVMSDEAVKSAAKYEDSLQDLKTALSGTKRTIISDFMPGITKVMDGLTEIFSGDSDKGIAMISEGLTSFVDKISEKLPEILEKGSQIVINLASAIVSNLDTLLPAAAEAILTIGRGLIEHLPEILETGLSVIVSLAMGIAQALPELIPVIVDVIIKIVDILTDPDNIGMLVDAALAIIMALATGLIEALPRLVEKIPEIIINLVTAIIENLPKIVSCAGEIIWALIKGIGLALYHLGEAAWSIIKELGNAIAEKAKDLWNKAKEIIDIVGEGIAHWASNLIEKGKEIVNGVWEGIKSKATEFYNNVVGFFKNIVDGVKNALGIASPSKVFASIGNMMAAGLEQGFDKGMDDAERSMTADMKDMVNALSGNMIGVDFASSGLGKSSAAMINSITGANIGGDMSVQVVLPDGTEVARAWLPDFLKAASAAGTPLLA